MTSTHLPAVDWLANALARSRPFARPQSWTHRQAFTGAVEARWIVRASALREIPCDECGATVPIDISHSGSLSAACACGWQSIDPIDLQLFRVDPARLRESIRTAFNVRQTVERDPLIPQVLWLLGDCGLQGARFPMWLAISNGRPNIADAVARALRISSPAEQGVIVAAGALRSEYPWPCKSELVSLGDLILLDGPTATLHPRAIYESAPEAAFGPRKGGRPPGLGDPMATLERRISEGRALSTLKREATAIERELRDKYGSRALSDRSIKTQITERFKEWRESVRALPT